MEKTLFACSSFHLTLKYSAIDRIRREKHTYTCKPSAFCEYCMMNCLKIMIIFRKLRYSSPSKCTSDFMQAHFSICLYVAIYQEISRGYQIDAIWVLCRQEKYMMLHLLSAVNPQFVKFALEDREYSSFYV